MRRWLEPLFVLPAFALLACGSEPRPVESPARALPPLADAGAPGALERVEATDAAASALPVTLVASTLLPSVAGDPLASPRSALYLRGDGGECFKVYDASIRKAVAKCHKGSLAGYVTVRMSIAGAKLTLGESKREALDDRTESCIVRAISTPTLAALEDNVENGLLYDPKIDTATRELYLYAAFY